MSSEIEELKSACFELARTTKWALKPVDTEDIKALSEGLSDIALERVDSGQELGVTNALITRAIHYLREAHAIPPMGEDTTWFANMLDTLLEIACPNASLQGEGRAFLKDMLNGIGTSITDDRI